MKKVIHWTFPISLALFFPAVALAQGNLTVAQNIVKSIGDIVDLLIPIAAGLALAGFFFGLAKYIFQAGDEDAQEEGKEIMIWGVIALFLIAAIGGIIAALESTLGLGNEGFDPTNFNDNLGN